MSTNDDSHYRNSTYVDDLKFNVTDSHLFEEMPSQRTSHEVTDERSFSTLHGLIHNQG